MIHTFNTRFLAAALCTASLSACGTLPASGPLGYEVRKNAVASVPAKETGEREAEAFRYALVKITRTLAQEFSALPKPYPQTDWPQHDDGEAIAINVGDTVQVTIYESRSGGLFIPSEAGIRPGNFVSLPSQIIDSEGMIEVPFAGSIHAVGRRPSDIGEEIARRLDARAIEPQAIVSVVNRNGSQVSVLGEIENATRFPIGLEGNRILDAIARAGGPKFPGYEMWVTLQRKSQEWSIPFDLLVMQPEKNISLAPEDTVYLYREPETYQVFGAAGFNGGYTFTQRNMTISQAIGQARGMNDSQADPAEVYIYRVEDKSNLKRYGDLLAKFEDTGDFAPVIYSLNLRKPDGYFMAQTFPIRNRDIIYIANAESVEFSKFLSILNQTAVTTINTEEAIR